MVRELVRLQARRQALMARVAEQRGALAAGIESLQPGFGLADRWIGRIGTLKQMVHDRPLLAGAVSAGAAMLLGTRIGRWWRRARVLAAVGGIVLDRLRADSACARRPTKTDSAER